jgi:hypothetical protein
MYLYLIATEAPFEETEARKFILYPSIVACYNWYKYFNDQLNIYGGFRIMAIPLLLRNEYTPTNYVLFFCVLQQL